MRIHLYTCKSDYEKVLGLLCDDIHHSIEVDCITDCQLINAAVSNSSDLFVLDDRLYDKMNRDCVDLIKSSQIKLIVLLKEKMNVKRYLAFNLVDYFVSPLNWDDIDERLRVEYRNYQFLKKSIGLGLEERLVVKTPSEIYAIQYSDILFLEKNQKVTRIHTYDKIYECHDSLKHLLISLPNEFIRIHSSYVVNFNNANHVLDIGNRTYHVIFDDYDECAVMSRQKSEELLEHAVNHYRMSIIDVDKKG
ncbi:LytTR family DNA-binding domain-containing protein [Acidaminobacter sp. JC074]|uniref:LytR/AlgR family response regulator transcription factor n=1 Tax=Acidaminobacter sp. JC074 TaxID=2530199 RepID=UPI001F0F373C|nr:LytTR family DNA-binding domain-containing protein [Acidaminobacter sp. JC074]